MVSSAGLHPRCDDNDLVSLLLRSSTLQLVELGVIRFEGHGPRLDLANLLGFPSKVDSLAISKVAELIEEASDTQSLRVPGPEGSV